MKVMAGAILATASLSTSGCVAMATQSAQKEARAQCAREDKIFVQREKASKGGLLSTVTVAGSCLGPDDPGYEEAGAALKAEAKAPK